MSIASWLTMSRLLVLPLTILPVSLGWTYGWVISASVIAFAGLTDIFDGRLARRMKQASTAGANLDLLADKVFVGTVLVILAAIESIPVWVPVVVLLREAVISLVRLSRFRSRTPSPDAWGKSKTAVTFVAMVLLMLQQDLNRGGLLSTVPSHVPVSQFLLLAPFVMLAAVALTLFSGANYLFKYKAVKRQD